MRVLAPQDRGAVKDWIDGCGDQAQGKVVLDSLANLQKGEGWVWFPEGAHLERSKFPAIKTFDSSATPEDGQERAAPKRAADVDLSEIRKMLADAAAEAQANDPKVLRARIAELEKEAVALRTEFHPSSTEPDPEDLAAERRTGYLEGRAEGNRAVNALKSAVNAALDGIGMPPQAHKIEAALLPSEPTAPQRKAPAGRQSSDSGLSKAERQLLIALAQRQPKALEQEQLAVFSGYSVGTGHFNNTVGALRSKEYITKGWPVSILPAGLEALGDYERLPTGRALLDWWCGRLSKAERAILLAAAHVYPNALSQDEWAGRAGYESGTGHFNNSLGRLRTLQLLSGRGEIKASENLFS
jgi:hypothetical protein